MGFFGASDLYENPDFVNASTNPGIADFHLAATSVAINRGASVSGVTPTSDHDGASRPQGGAYDLGAYETSQTGTNPLPSAYVQAETGTLSGPSISTGQSGYTGTGYVDYGRKAGQYAQWSVNQASAGVRTLVIRYAHGRSGGIGMDVYVNGTRIVANQPFDFSGAWSAWSLIVLPNVSLNAGANTIRLTQPARGEGPNIDYVQVAP